VKELFLCHHSKFAGEIDELAAEHRLRGVAPWVDKHRGGFLIGDSSPEEARRVIQEDCFGFLLYATPGVFDRRFIREVELPAAKQAKAQDANYVLTGFSRGLSFRTLRQRSLESFGIDLSEFHGISSRRNITEAQRREDWVKQATEVLRKWLALQPATPRLSLQFSTRQLFPDDPDDLLRIDATAYLANYPLAMTKWDALRRALLDVQTEITYCLGRPRLLVHGSKHLTAAFLFGRVFARNVIDIRQMPTAVWSSDVAAATIRPFQTILDGQSTCDGSLFVQIASGYKNIAAGVDDVIRSSAVAHPARLSLTPSGGPLDVDNALCVAMVNQAYAEIERAIAITHSRSIHLFVAAHQAFMMMLGQRFSGMPEVHLYEWDNGDYIKTCVIPGGPARAAQAPKGMIGFGCDFAERGKGDPHSKGPVFDLRFSMGHEPKSGDPVEYNITDTNPGLLRRSAGGTGPLIPSNSP
jgi:hypothetical protein